MIIYNVTSNIEDSCHDQWMEWMMEKHIPEILDTGKFYKIKILKVLSQEDHGTTYSVQYFAESREKLEQYYKEHAPKLRADALGKFGEKVLAFRTELEIMKEFKSI